MHGLIACDRCIAMHQYEYACVWDLALLLRRMGLEMEAFSEYVKIMREFDKAIHDGE
jgi:hypothetical protein